MRLDGALFIICGPAWTGKVCMGRVWSLLEAANKSGAEIGDNGLHVPKTER